MKTISAVLLWLIPLLLVTPARGQQSPFSKQLWAQLSDKSKLKKLHYPKSVIRYYARIGFQPAWIKNNKDSRQIWEAMMLLDCVLQYGLAHADYHPKELTYEQLPEMIKAPEKVSEGYKARFDLLLTDALITLINHLHYGKLNPAYSRANIENLEKINGFDACDELTHANNAADFTTAILSVQPKSIAYLHLQRYMKLIKGQYVGDCYEVPELEVRKIAINMERLRWWEFNEKKTHKRKAPYLTCEIIEGLPVFHKDILKLDKALEAAMYTAGKRIPTSRKKPSVLPKIHIKKD